MENEQLEFVKRVNDNRIANIAHRIEDLHIYNYDAMSAELERTILKIWNVLSEEEKRLFELSNKNYGI